MASVAGVAGDEVRWILARCCMAIVAADAIATEVGVIRLGSRVPERRVLMAGGAVSSRRNCRVTGRTRDSLGFACIMAGRASGGDNHRITVVKTLSWCKNIGAMAIGAIVRSQQMRGLRSLLFANNELATD